MSAGIRIQRFATRRDVGSRRVASRDASDSSNRIRSLLLVSAAILVAFGPVVLGQTLTEPWMAPGSIPEVTTLLNVGADLTETDAQGRTALHYAATNEDAGITDLLLRYGADPDATDFTGSTPLHLAAAGNRNHLVVETLVRFGADFAARDVSGRTPLEVATMSNANSSVVDSLRELGSTSESLSEVPISRLIYSDWPNSVTIDRLRARPAFSDDTEEGIGSLGGCGPSCCRTTGRVGYSGREREGSPNCLGDRCPFLTGKWRLWPPTRLGRNESFLICGTSRA